MCLFGKLGGKDATVTMGKSGYSDRVATISFGGPALVAKFLVQATHTISESGITEVAHVGPCRGCSICGCVAQPESEQNDVALGTLCENQSMNRGNLPHDVGQTSHTGHEVMQASTQPSCAPCVFLGATVPQAPSSSSYVSSSAQSLSMPLALNTFSTPSW